MLEEDHYGKLRLIMISKDMLMNIVITYLRVLGNPNLNMKRIKLWKKVNLEEAVLNMLLNKLKRDKLGSVTICWKETWSMLLSSTIIFNLSHLRTLAYKIYSLRIYKTCKILDKVILIDLIKLNISNRKMMVIDHVIDEIIKYSITFLFGCILQ